MNILTDLGIEILESKFLRGKGSVSCEKNCKQMHIRDKIDVV